MSDPECQTPTHRSAADAVLFDDLLVAGNVLALDIVQELAAQADHLQKATTGVVVLLVRLEVVGQFVDAVGEDGDLHFRRAGIVDLGRVVFDHGRLGRSTVRGYFRHRDILSWQAEGVRPLA